MYLAGKEQPLTKVAWIEANVTLKIAKTMLKSKGILNVQVNSENMEQVIEAIYEKGVFKPLKKVDLKEGERVKIRIGSYKGE